jgi:diguanylate cyclase (GGDEF)-like protein
MGTTVKDRRIRPTHRTIVMAVVALLATVAVTTVAVITVSRVRAPADRLADAELPALSAINDTAAAMARSQALLLTAIGTTNADTRSAAIAEAAAVSATQDGAWSRFIGRGDQTAAVKDLIDQYTVTDEQSRSLGAALITSDPATDPDYQSKLATEQASFEHQADLVEQLRRIYVPQASVSISAIEARTDGSRFWLLVTFVAAFVVMAVTAAIVLVDARRDERGQTQARADRAVAARRTDLETRLQRGLEMAPTEAAAFDVVSQALRLVGGETAIEVLAADSSHAHFRRATATDADEHYACAVGGPHDCPAASSGQTRVFTDSTTLDACPYLREHEPAWSMCVPISMAGRTTGVVHAEGPLPSAPPSTLRPELELVARKTGDRIGALRILARTESQAQLDPLTGLANRRNLERRVHEILSDGSPFVVAFVDLDHFKDLNDTHGHDTGDRALRLFGRVLRDSVRPHDIAARYGGEEFVVVLPGGSLHEARAVVDRLRGHLEQALTTGAVPSFTISAGLAASLPDEPFDEVIARADSMLLRAKLQGRNRTVSFGDELDAESLLLDS